MRFQIRIFIEQYYKNVGKSNENCEPFYMVVHHIVVAMEGKYRKK